MQTDSPARAFNDNTNMTRGFRNVGLVFAVLGVAAILAPAVATIVVEQLVAWLMVFWGIAGLIFARSFRGMSEWRIVAFFFAALLIAGLIFVFYPGHGATFLTAVMVIVFLLDGILSVMLGLRLRERMPSWRWVIVSGACALLLGIVILVQWPTASTWVLGFLIGLNFLSTGVSMLVISRATAKLRL